MRHRTEGFRSTENKAGVFSTRIQNDINDWLTAYCKANNINKTHFVNDTLRSVMNGKKNEEREDGWILTSDRLPEPSGHERYLVSVAHYDPQYEGVFVTIDEYEARDPKTIPNWDRIRGNEGVRVVAWMPLPKPYEGR